MIKKIISGGQPGVERAALDAAIKLNIPHSGWTYKTRRTDEGILPDKYSVKESAAVDFSDRIEKNVLDSDATAILTHGSLTIGLKIVKDYAEKHNRPYLHVADARNIFHYFHIEGIWCCNGHVSIFNGDRKDQVFHGE